MVSASLRWLVALWLAATLVSGPGVVVCRAADGHAEVEIAHVGGCEDGAEPHGESIGTPMNGCSDSVLFGSAVRVDPAPQRVALPLAVLTCFSHAVDGRDFDFQSRGSGAAPSRPPSHLMALASTVLRI